MFGNWKVEKAVQALVDEAQALADKLEGAKPHFVESYLAEAMVWVVIYQAEGVDLRQIAGWKPEVAAKFAKAAAAKIAVLRKARDYGPSDGLTVWLHTARSVSEPRMVPAVRAIWRELMKAGPNADGRAVDLLAEAGLTGDVRRFVPKGYESED